MIFKVPSDHSMILWLPGRAGWSADCWRKPSGQACGMNSTWNALQALQLQRGLVLKAPKTLYPPETSHRESLWVARPETRVMACAGFDWGTVNFLHSTWYRTVFWICAGNRVDNTGMFKLLLSSSYTELRPFQPFTLPYQWVDWESTCLGQLTSVDHRDIPDQIASCSAYKARGRRRKGSC